MKNIFPIVTYIHILQLEGYDPLRFAKWWFSHILARATGSKKPLVWTSKAKRLYFLSVGLTFFLAMLGYFTLESLGILLIFICFLIVFPTPQLMFSLLLIKPYEIWNRQRTIEKTREKINSFGDLKVIGVTGSYGKTSVKEFLYRMLKSQYQVLRTPKSYNTVFGIAKVVDFELDSSYDYFICEMGGYKRGEIAELCKMVAPKYGIVTGIAEQHLERFGSLENIILGKFELVESLPRDGLAILNTDNHYIKERLDQVEIPFLTYGLQNIASGIKAEDIKISVSGTSFTINLSGKTTIITTKLLGRSSLQNILGAATLAYEIGVSLPQIAEVVKNLDPIPHRLQLIKSNYTIIDDAYNSNPEGFREALEVVSLFPAKRKILVTPGIVDLGRKNEMIHNELGQLAAKVFSNVILVGKSKRTEALRQGLRSAGFDSNLVIIAQDLEEARSELVKVVQKETVVLFENDLPDNY